MADISKITLPSNDEYNIKDATARSGLATKQDILVSGTNIKTINNESLLGSGNITIQGGGDSLPDQTGHSGDILTTNGTAVSWMDVSEASSVSIDTSISSSSTDNTIPSSKAVWDALSNVDALPDQAGHSGDFLTTNGTTASWTDLPEEIFVCIYDTQDPTAQSTSTSFDDATAAFEAGKTLVAKRGILCGNLVRIQSSFMMFSCVVNSSNVKLWKLSDTGWEETSSGYIEPPSSPSNGDVLTYDSTNGWVASAPSGGLPDQTGHSGEYLTTTGSTSYWANLPKEIFWCAYGSTSFLEIQEAFQSFNQLCALDYLGKIYIYTYGDYGNYSYHYFINVTGNEINKITVDDMNSWSGPVSTTIDNLPSQTGNSGKYLTTNGTAASWGAASATSTKSIDSSPTSASSNLVTSGGVYTAINNKVNRTTAVNAADTNYTTLMARGVKLMDATSYDAVSDWSSELVNGAIAWRYE